MSKTNSSLPGLFHRKPPTDLIGPSPGRASVSRIEKISGISGSRALSLTAKDTLTGIKFGSPSSSNATGTTKSRTTDWERLLQHTASRGLSSAMKGTFSLADLGGIGTAISSLFKVFGGGKSANPLPPLVEFALPNPVAQTVYVNAGVSGTDSASLRTNRGIYRTTGNEAGASAPVFNASQIAQAVKHALLTSSSLNDVISEI